MTCITRTRHSFFIVIITAEEDAGGDADDADEAQDDEGESKHKQHQPQIFLPIPDISICCVLHPLSSATMAILLCEVGSANMLQVKDQNAKCTD